MWKEIKVLLAYGFIVTCVWIFADSVTSAFIAEASHECKAD